MKILFSKLASLFYKKCPKAKAVNLLESCARKGDLQAQKMLNLYHSLQNEQFSPMQDLFLEIRSSNLPRDLMKQIRKSKHRKKPTKQIRKARNPKRDK